MTDQPPTPRGSVASPTRDDRGGTPAREQGERAPLDEQATAVDPSRRAGFEHGGGADERGAEVEHRRFRAVALATYLVALLSWLALFTSAVPLPGGGSAAAMAAPGMPEAMALAAGPVGIVLYLLAWGVMMVAMMYPAEARVFQGYADVRRSTSGPTVPFEVAAFVLTYTLVWTLLGVVPLAVNLLVPIAALAVGNGALFAGAALLLLSAYQLSPAKTRCLQHCRSPATALRGHDALAGLDGAVRSSWHLTVYDVGACWTLMALMVVVGSMNVLWMAAITVLLTVERLASWGVTFARGLGVVGGVGGAALLVVGLA